jgi:hypothetical protein
MGLTIHVQLKLEQKLAARAVETMVGAMHARAGRLVKRRGLAGISPVVPAEAELQCLRWITVETGPNESTGIEVAPTEGWCFAVLPGAGCEPAYFGLCRYPATVAGPGGKRRRTGAGAGWSFAGFCKTQYAAIHGWEHFLRCHRAVVDLSLLWEPMGVEVQITDEGDYWPGRNVRALRERLGVYDRAVAGLAGALKDAADEAGGPAVQATIFEHPQFERLEAEGADTVKGAVEIVRKEVKRARPSAGAGPAGE